MRASLPGRIQEEAGSKGKVKKKRDEVAAMPRKKRERGAESTVTVGGRGSPVRRKTKVMSTVQASDRDAALWDMRFAKAEMGGEIETESVGSLYDDDPTGCKPSRSRKHPRA